MTESLHKESEGAYTGSVRATWVWVEVPEVPLEEYTREELEAAIEKCREMPDWRQARAEAKCWKTHAVKLADVLRQYSNASPALTYFDEALAWSNGEKTWPRT